jgi:hypothetical protein
MICPMCEKEVQELLPCPFHPEEPECHQCATCVAETNELIARGEEDA